MSRRPPILGVLVVIVIALALLAGVQIVSAQLTRAPDQPIAFTHATHAGKLSIDCAFCHRNVDKGATASVPAVQQCMFCHAVVTQGERGGSGEEIAKLRDAFEKERPVDWIRVHRLPDHVRFIHEAHVRGLTDRYPYAGLKNVCATCHGEVAGTVKVEQVRQLKMGDCVACHRANGAPTDCTTCHK